MNILLVSPEALRVREFLPTKLVEEDKETFNYCP